jgi:hypothetical protein
MFPYRECIARLSRDVPYFLTRTTAPGMYFFNLGTKIELGLIPASLVYGFLIH